MESRVVMLCLWFAIWSGMTSAARAGDESSRFYDPETLQTIHLEIPAADLLRMRRALPERIEVPGVFRWMDQVWTNVGIRYKGSSSSIPEAQHKRAFLVSFSSYKKGQRFLGLRHVALDNGVQFGSLFSERLITDILRGVGVKASRCNYAQVFLNGNCAGVYVNVERIDESFLERNFDSGRGVLFKVDQGGPGADLRYVGESFTPYRQTFELHAGKQAEAFGHLLEFIRVLNDPAGPRARWQACLDWDALLRTTAVLLFAGAFDQYTGWGPHNYYLFRHPVEQRWVYIPWDLDVGFADHAFGRIPVLSGWNAAWPAPVPGRPLMERIVSDPALLERYRVEARAILETWFRPEVLIPKLRRLHAQIRSALDQDPYPPRRVTVPADTSYQDILASMEAFIRARYALARAQLEAPGERPPFHPIPPGPEPGSSRPGPHPGVGP